MTDGDRENPFVLQLPPGKTDWIDTGGEQVTREMLVDPHHFDLVKDPQFIADAR